MKTGEQPTLLRVCVGSAQRYIKIQGDMVRAGQSLFGELLEYLGQAGMYYHVRTCLDGYESYVLRNDASPELIDATHYVCVPRTFALDDYPVQAAQVMMLGMMSPVRIVEEHGKFVRLEDCGWVSRHHVRALGDYERDFVEVALRYLGDPYAWGSRIFPDCSLIVQSPVLATGQHAQRTAGEQMEQLGGRIPIDFGTLRRGDLPCWKGHVGIMLDGCNILHACDDAMIVSIEPLANVIERRRREEVPAKAEILAIKRIPGYGE